MVWRESTRRFVNRQNVSLRISPKFIGLSRFKLPRPRPSSARQQHSGQFVGHAEHRVVPGIEFGPARVEPFGGAALMGFARVLRAAAPDDASLPGLGPE